MTSVANGGSFVVIPRYLQWFVTSSVALKFNSREVQETDGGRERGESNALPSQIFYQFQWWNHAIALFQPFARRSQPKTWVEKKCAPSYSTKHSEMNAIKVRHATIFLHPRRFTLFPFVFFATAAKFLLFSISLLCLFIQFVNIIFDFLFFPFWGFPDCLSNRLLRRNRKNK